MGACVALVAVIGVAGTVFGAATEPAEEPVSRPAWVSENGVVLPDKAPAVIRVAAFDGTPLLDADGVPVTTPYRAFLLAPDPVAQAEEDLRIRRLQVLDARRRGLDIPGVESVIDAQTGKPLQVDPIWRAQDN